MAAVYRIEERKCATCRWWNGERGIEFRANDYLKERTPPPATPIRVLADGRIRISKELLDHAGIKARALFTGTLRTIKLTCPRH